MDMTDVENRLARTESRPLGSDPQGVPVLRTLSSRTSVILLSLAVLAGCNRQQQASAPQAPPAPKVTAAKPVLQEVTDYQEYNGYLEAVETVTVRTRVRGFLQRVAFKEGADVKRGDLLYEI